MTAEAFTRRFESGVWCWNSSANFNFVAQNFNEQKIRCRCDERIQKIQTFKMIMEGIFICAAPHCLKSFLKKSEFESHIHERFYYVPVLVGNPPRPYFLDPDTGSDLTWLQCDAPVQCTRVSNWFIVFGNHQLKTCSGLKRKMGSHENDEGTSNSSNNRMKSIKDIRLRSEIQQLN